MKKHQLLVIFALGTAGCTQFSSSPPPTSTPDATPVFIQSNQESRNLSVSQLAARNSQLTLGGCGATSTGGSARFTRFSSPVAFQVFQRNSETRYGQVFFEGGAQGATCIEVNYRSLDSNGESGWMTVTNASTNFSNFRLPVATHQGSYNISVRVVSGNLIGEQRLISDVGVGEVFITAGQSNASFAGDTPLDTTSGRVSYFDGTEWKRCRDTTYEPNIGTTISAGARIDPFGPAGNLGFTGVQRQGGSMWCPFGDSLFAYWRVPVAIVPIALSGSNSFKWLPYSKTGNLGVQQTPNIFSYFNSVQTGNYVNSLGQLVPNLNTYPVGTTNRADNISYAAAMAAGAYGYVNRDNDPNNGFVAPNPLHPTGRWAIENDNGTYCPRILDQNGNAIGDPNFYYNSCFLKGFLYARLVGRLKFLRSYGGLRAVLWHQGEGDVIYQSTLKGSMPDNHYSDNLNTIIRQSRIDAGLPGVPWLVSLVSVTQPQWINPFNANGSAKPAVYGSKDILRAGVMPTAADRSRMRAQQLLVIQSNPNVYLGVSTDDMIGLNADGTETYRSNHPGGYPHFNRVGLIEVARRWLTAVMTAFPGR